MLYLFKIVFGREVKLTTCTINKDRDREQELTHLFVHFNVKAVGHLIILKQRKKKKISY